jgi:ectoine hydroxylase-related dioxygenase (phytanoyl-CoA dioxygenase family)
MDSRGGTSQHRHRGSAGVNRRASCRLVACVALLHSPLCVLQASSFVHVNPQPSRPPCLSASQGARLASRLYQTQVQSVVVEAPDDSAAARRRFMYMTDEQDRLLQQMGDREACLMGQASSVPLETFVVKPGKAKKTKSAAGAKGFGAASKKKMTETSQSTQLQSTASQSAESFSPETLATAQSCIKELEQRGLVRLDNVMSDALCDSLRDYLVDLRDRSIQAVEQGTILDSQDRFADVLLNRNRCDLKIPLGPQPVMDSLRHLLADSPIRPIVQGVFDKYTDNNGKLATLYELNCFMSKSGARRQLVHADQVFGPPGQGLDDAEPALITCFVALQDVDATMGPTIWIPQTHNRPAHNQFYTPDNDKSYDGNDDEEGTKVAESSKERLLKSRPSVIGTLPKGSCVVFDPRTLHCAGANTCTDPDKTRALFYFSFKHPRVDHPGCPSCSGYGLVDADLTMETLCNELDSARRMGFSRKLDLLSCYP